MQIGHKFTQIVLQALRQELPPQQFSIQFTTSALQTDYTSPQPALPRNRWHYGGLCHVLVETGTPWKAVILTNSRSAIHVLLDFEARIPLVVTTMTAACCDVRWCAAVCELAFRWLSAHTGIMDNTIAATIASDMHQTDIPEALFASKTR